MTSTDRRVRAGIATIAVLAVLILLGVAAVLLSQDSTEPSASVAAPTRGPVMRDDSHVLDDAGADAVTVVEFLDFECEACGAFYPVVEDLRTAYAGRLTYVVRYFPLPGHRNSTNAALAAEAAAQQGRFEDMYRMLFDNQAAWGEATESQAHVFRGFAEELGLDLVAYDRAVADPATAERVEVDVRDGRALGVDRTPTFFVDGRELQLETYDDLEDAIVAATAPPSTPEALRTPSPSPSAEETAQPDDEQQNGERPGEREDLGYLGGLVLVGGGFVVVAGAVGIVMSERARRRREREAAAREDEHVDPR